LAFFKKINVLSDKDFSLLHKINDIRNRHIHPKMKDEVYNDAKLIINLLCELLEGRLSMLNRYDIVDGKFVLKKDKKLN
jgi:hypothetical protein